jgi:CubicO group peptidase (beta-lactamase class C family)
MGRLVCIFSYGCAVGANDLSGVAVARRGGVIVAERAAGMADRELGLPCTPETRFQIASVSKQFTAAAVLLLASQSQLSLDDPVNRWFGGCPQDWQAITIHHLLTHTSGLGHLEDFPALDLYRPIEPAQELSIFQQQPLLSAPGSHYRYSSPGYTLLAWIVEKAVGQPYVSFLANRVFTPLGMHTASAGDPPGGTGMARGYHAGEPVPSFELATIGVGAGDIWCTAAELLRWDEAIAHGELLPAGLREAMFTPHALTGTTASGEGWSFTGYGYGWMIGTAAGRRAYFHTGDNSGYLAVNAWLPDEQVALAVLANDQAIDILQVATDLLELAR